MYVVLYSPIITHIEKDIIMKMLICIFALVAVGLEQVIFAQDSTAQYIQQVITDYLNVKNALTKDKADSVSHYARTLSADLQSIPIEKLSADKHEIWDQYYEALINGAKEIGSNADLKHQRKHFSKLSLTLYQMVRAMEINTFDLYYQYCSMEDTYWVSEKSKISNPYFGKKMPTCGSTKETLKAKK